MKSAFVAVALIAGLGLPSLAGAHGPDKQAASSPDTITAAAKPAVAVVDQFATALHDGDFKRVGELLADDVLILESGGAERTREEYLGEHAIQDALFLKNAHSEVTHRTARIDGDLAWVGTESTLHATRDGKPMTLLSTETMVLKQTPVGWRIVHIHWSSRPKKEG